MGEGEIIKATELKIILPGEYGYVFDSRTCIGTFAVGANKGCRGYLVIDQKNRWAGLAHVDFWELDPLVIRDLINCMRNKGSEELFLHITPNSRIDPLSIQQKSLRVDYIYGTEFLYNPMTNQISYVIPPASKKVLQERLPILRDRLRSGQKSLILV